MVRRPGVGLPLPINPGQRDRPRLPPSKDKRPLPATREPGIWASDETRASSAPPATLDIADVNVPSETKNGTEEIRACRAIVLDALITTNTLKALRELPLAERTCEIFRLQENCLARKQVTKAREATLKAALELTARRRQDACKGIALDRFKSIREPVGRVLRKTLGGWVTVTRWSEKP